LTSPARQVALLRLLIPLLRRMIRDPSRNILFHCARLFTVPAAVDTVNAE
jgi:hypothetical protein